MITYIHIAHVTVLLQISNTCDGYNCKCKANEHTNKSKVLETRKLRQGSSISLAIIRCLQRRTACSTHQLKLSKKRVKIDYIMQRAVIFAYISIAPAQIRATVIRELDEGHTLGLQSSYYNRVARIFANRYSYR